MVVSGRVNISKSISFFDENDILKRKDQLIMEIEGGDVIGEDFIWFDRPCSYSARALSNTVRVLSIKNSSFDKYFGKCIPASKKMFEQRNQFMQDRYDQLRFQIEYRCLKFNNKISY